MPDTGTRVMSACPVCGEPARVTYCSPACASEARHWQARAARADLIEDVEFLLKSGESVDVIPARLGATLQALMQRLYRCGRSDLARPFFALDNRRRSLRRQAAPSSPANDATPAPDADQPSLWGDA